MFKNVLKCLKCFNKDKHRTNIINYPKKILLKISIKNSHFINTLKDALNSLNKNFFIMFKKKKTNNECDLQ